MSRGVSQLFIVGKAGQHCQLNLLYKEKSASSLKLCDVTKCSVICPDKIVHSKSEPKCQNSIQNPTVKLSNHRRYQLRSCISEKENSYNRIPLLRNIANLITLLQRTAKVANQIPLQSTILITLSGLSKKIVYVTLVKKLSTKVIIKKVSKFQGTSVESRAPKSQTTYIE